MPHYQYINATYSAQTSHNHQEESPRPSPSSQRHRSWTNTPFTYEPEQPNVYPSTPGAGEFHPHYIPSAIIPSGHPTAWSTVQSFERPANLYRPYSEQRPSKPDSTESHSSRSHHNHAKVILPPVQKPSTAVPSVNGVVLPIVYQASRSQPELYFPLASPPPRLPASRQDLVLPSQEPEIQKKKERGFAAIFRRKDKGKEKEKEANAEKEHDLLRRSVIIAPDPIPSKPSQRSASTKEAKAPHVIIPKQDFHYVPSRRQTLEAPVVVAPPTPATPSSPWSIHTILQLHHSLPPAELPWDLRWPFDAAVPHILQSTPSHPFNQPASSPPAFNIRLHHTSLPWPVNITARTSRGITVFDVLSQLHISLQKAVTDAEWRIVLADTERGKERKRDIEAARVRRCAQYKGGPTEEKSMMLRVDFLKRDVFLKGLVSDEAAVEKMLGKATKFPRVLELVMVLDRHVRS